ncbi:MAG: hypothetical protein ABJA50_03665 [Chloroflexota bacterium]
MTNQHDNQNMSDAGTPSARDDQQTDWGSEGTDMQQDGGGQRSVSGTGGDWGSTGEQEMNNGNIITDTTTPGDESTEDNVQPGGSWGERTTGWYGGDKTRAIAAVEEDWGSQGIDPDDDGTSNDWGSQGVDADEETDGTDTPNHIPHH